MVCVVKLSIAYSGLKTDSRRGRGSYDSLSTLYRKGELSPKTICIGEFGSTRKKLYLPCTENESWVLKQSVYVHWVPLEKKAIVGLSPVKKSWVNWVPQNKTISVDWVTFQCKEPCSIIILFNSMPCLSSVLIASSTDDVIEVTLRSKSFVAETRSTISGNFETWVFGSVKLDSCRL